MGLLIILIVAIFLLIFCYCVYKNLIIPRTFIFDPSQGTFTVKYMQSVKAFRSDEIYRINDIGEPWIDYIQTRKDWEDRFEEFATFKLKIPITPTKIYEPTIGCLHRVIYANGFSNEENHGQVITHVRNTHRHLCEILRYHNQSPTPMHLRVNNYDLDAGRPISYM